MNSYFAVLAILLFLSNASLAQNPAPKMSVTESVERLRDWISPDNSSRSVANDIWVERALKVMTENYDHPEVQKFVKNGDAVERTIRVCGGPCKRIFLVGLASPDLKTVEKTRAILREVLQPPRVSAIPDGSIVAESLKNYKDYLLATGNKYRTEDPQKLLEDHVESFSNILFGVEASVTPENQYAYLRLRIKLTSDLATIQGQKPVSERELLERWYIADSGIATPEHFVKALKSLNVSDSALKEMNKERAKTFARWSSCRAYRLNEDSQSEVWAALKESIWKETTNWSTTTDFSDQVKDLIKVDPEIMSKIVEEWPELIVAALGKAKSAAEVAQLRLLTTIGARGCQEQFGSNLPAGHSPQTTVRRCIGGCDDAGSCRAWDSLESELTTIQAEAKQMRAYLDTIDPSKIVISESIMYEIRRDEKSITNQKKFMEQMKESGPTLKASEALLRQLRKDVDEAKNQLAPKDQKACVLKELSTRSGKPAARNAPPSSGLQSK